MRHLWNSVGMFSRLLAGKAAPRCPAAAWTDCADTITPRANTAEFPAARLLIVSQAGTDGFLCVQPEFDCMLDCSRATIKNDLRAPPPNKHIIHWSLDDSPTQAPGKLL